MDQKDECGAAGEEGWGTCEGGMKSMVIFPAYSTVYLLRSFAHRQYMVWREFSLIHLLSSFLLYLLYDRLPAALVDDRNMIKRVLIKDTGNCSSFLAVLLRSFIGGRGSGYL